ncbi:hypothetical protein FK513_29960, partial [Klebsiella pneumoniae]|uniref:AIR synthase-related protein n=1 Tax=Klebsiella pneumoniae TaxID=573 RepID=UPI00210D0B08
PITCSTSAPRSAPCAATRADPAELRRALALLPELAAEGSLCAAKDISQAGLAGTLTMMLESCGLGAEVTLEQIPISIPTLNSWRVFTSAPPLRC